jgi:hypothetical protein
MKVPGDGGSQENNHNGDHLASASPTRTSELMSHNAWSVRTKGVAVPFSLEEDLPVLAQAVVVLVEVFLLRHGSLLGDAPALVKFERRLPYSF